MVARYEIQNIRYLECFVSSLELKMDVLPANSCVTHEFKLHDHYTVSSEDVSSYTEPLTA